MDQTQEHMGHGGREKKVVARRPQAWQILSADEKTPLRIGELPWYGPWTGPGYYQSIDEVAIWDRALIDAEVKVLYNNGHGVKIPVN